MTNSPEADAQAAAIARRQAEMKAMVFVMPDRVDTSRNGQRGTKRRTKRRALR